MSTTDRGRAICLVGAGPRGTSVLERLCAWAAHRPTGRHLDVHVVDPFPPGPGRIWRRAQSDLLWMNSTVAAVRMFTGPEAAVHGPAGPLPSFAEWLSAVAPYELPAAQAASAQRLTGDSFAPRPLVGEYFTWVFDRVVGTAPESVRIVVHRTRATDVADGPDGSQVVTLADRSRLEVDQVVLAQGNFESRATPEERRLAEFADQHRLRYFPSGYFDEERIQEVPAGEPVLLRGFGLTFVDCMALLCEGRGGRFEQTGDGLAYRSSGREPVLFVGSRRGLPYHAKFGYPLPAGPQPLPRYFTADAARSRGAPLEFDRDLWPLLSKEVAAAYYREFFRARPDRVRGTWTDFAAALADLDWGGREWDELVARSVPAESDRFTWDLLDGHLEGTWGDAEALQREIRRYIDDDLRHRCDPAHSPQLAAVNGLLAAVEVLIGLVESEALSARSLVLELEKGFLPLVSFVTSGPPPRRLAELLALSRAGLVRFLGPDVAITADPERGIFRAASPVVPDVVEARCLIESRLRAPTLPDTGDDLLRRLRDRGECAARTHLEQGVGYTTGKIGVRASDHRLLHADGRAHPRRFAVGPYVAGVHAAGDGPVASGFFEISDLLARSALGIVASPEPAPA
ncbi:FAD/NAD(P)-binding protein [Saccharopolyspora cebuensis]|uniref:FAD/NAD(P)-binding protein n=1 Tax=Saccharopolyspora cebuensis TaxID=418759 RepID=A0ABV4CHK8_9PSEU